MTKPVTLSEEAYRLLRELKRGGESFSDVVIRLAGKAKKDPRAFLRIKLDPAFGSWDDVEAFRERMRRTEARKSRRLHGAK